MAPVGRDAALTVSLLESQGRAAVVCADTDDLAAAIKEGAGLAVITGEALNVETVETLSRTVAAQPPWSDFPFLVFTSFGAEQVGADTLDMLQWLGNVTLLDRPVRVTSLLSAVNAALRARRRQYEMRELVEQLRDGVRQRDQFLAMLGHELRNPLGALLTAVEILDLDARSLPQGGVSRKPRAVIRRQGQILARLVDDLLDVSRVTSGKVSLQKAQVDMRTIAQRCIDALRPAARQQTLELRFSAPAEPLWLDGDPTRLEQVLLNVSNNAIKYTPAGGLVEVSLRREGATVVVTVRDTGAGIDAATLPVIFDLFRQADRTLHRAQGGLGIGLTLVRSLVELHGGTVSARSEGLGRGSTFEIRLPALTAVPEALPLLHTEPTSTVRRHVFIVEDNADNRDGLVLLLENLGHHVESEGDGSASVPRIVDSRPELAFVDIGLPGIDGYEVARRVRRELGSGIVLVALTGYGQDEDQRRALEAGFDTHMAKPIDFVSLMKLLAEPRRVRAAG